MMLGVWLEMKKPAGLKGGRENIAQTMQGINLANEYKDLIAAVCVGNETQVTWSAHRMDQDDLIRYIRLVRNNTNCPLWPQLMITVSGLPLTAKRLRMKLTLLLHIFIQCGTA
ncbi:MAG: hypothetical protein U5L72_19435 [Bacteroidales bacterium]|nr:hypothetical protein [Bacteroidales bacterium]